MGGQPFRVQLIGCRKTRHQPHKPLIGSEMPVHMVAEVPLTGLSFKAGAYPTSHPQEPLTGDSLQGAIAAGDKIGGFRQWASGGCLSADRAGVYSRSEEVSGGRVRRVVREPGVN
jgi:hypothetical protein